MKFIKHKLLFTLILALTAISLNTTVNAIWQLNFGDVRNTISNEGTPLEKKHLIVFTRKLEMKASLASTNTLLKRVGVDPRRTKALTLNNAIRLALQSNNEVEVARNDVKIAESKLRSLLGFYDPVFTATPKYTNNVQPQPSTLGGADLSGVTKNNTFKADLSLDKPIKQGGGNFNVFFNNTRDYTSSLFSRLNPTFSTNFGFSFRQPVWRNRKIDENRRRIRIQRKIISQSDADFRKKVIEIISQVQRNYWDLFFALSDQQNRVVNLNLAKENLRQIDAKIAAGSAAPLQRAEVNTELANRESELLVASQQVSIAENSLKRLLLKDLNSPEWSDSFVPTDQPVFSTTPINLDSAIKDAIANRPELRRLRLQSDINTIDIDYFKNQIKPRVDFTTTYRMIGLSGAATGRIASNTIPSRFRGGYSQSLQNLFSNNTRSFEVGVTLTFPLRNKTAEANLATAEFQKQRIAAQKRLQEQSVITEVRNAVQVVETARQRVLTSRRARKNAEIQLEGERKLYNVGRSTTFLLFQRENALTKAKNTEMRSKTDYNKALADLQKATSTTLRANNIMVDPQLKTGN